MYISMVLPDAAFLKIFTIKRILNPSVLVVILLKIKRVNVTPATVKGL